MDQATAWIWMSLFGLGLFHGLNPAMGWLFAVGLGLQEGRVQAVIYALWPIAIGHAAAIGLAAFITTLIGFALPSNILLVLTGVVLLLFSGWRLLARFRHPKTRFRASVGELAWWSFLMAGAHGAGLMVAPLLVAMESTDYHMHLHHSHAYHTPVIADSLLAATLAVVVHTVGMFAAMTVIALIVYQIAGLEILRPVWINTDLVWVAVLAVTGIIAIGLGVWNLG